MLRYLVLDSIKYRSPGLGWLRFWQLLHDRTNGALNEAYVRLSRLWRPALPAPQSAMLPTVARAETVAHLKRDGYAVLPVQLPAADIAALRQFAFSTPAYSDDFDKAVLIPEDNIPTDVPIFVWRMADMAANPTIQDIVLNGPFWAIAQDYLGCRPTLSTMSLWLNTSFKGENGQFVYHYDNDGPKFLKFFIYLTDVEIGTGAHYFIKGTQHPQKPPQFARSKRYGEQELLDHYGHANECVAAGPAGTILAEDTMGFHRGSTITHGYRMLLQLQYSVVDIKTKEDLARSYAPVAVPGLDAGVARVHSKFWRTPS